MQINKLESECNEKVAVIEELQKRLELAKVEKSKLEVSNGKKDDDLKATLIKIEELEQDIEQLQRKLNEPSQENQSSPSISQQATFSVASSASFISDSEDLTGDETASSQPQSTAITSKFEEKWLAKYEQLKQYKREHGDCLVPHAHSSLGKWVNNQRCRRVKILQDQIDMVLRL
ncbi:hypothetical protein ACHAXN_001030 [Cyclotella atomus]